jgi:hypothetical protein
MVVIGRDTIPHREVCLMIQHKSNKAIWSVTDFKIKQSTQTMMRLTLLFACLVTSPLLCTAFSSKTRLTHYSQLNAVKRNDIPVAISIALLVGLTNTPVHADHIVFNGKRSIWNYWPRCMCSFVNMPYFDYPDVTRHWRADASSTTFADP